MRVTSEVSWTKPAALASGLLDGPLDEQGAQAAATLLGVDADALDDRAGGAPTGEAGNDRQLEGADDLVLTDGHDEVLMGVVRQALEGHQVRAEVVGGFALRAQRVVGQHRDDGFDVLRGGGTYLKIAHAPQSTPGNVTAWPMERAVRVRRPVPQAGTPTPSTTWTSGASSGFLAASSSASRRALSLVGRASARSFW